MRKKHLSGEVELIHQKRENWVQGILEKIPATWPQFFWSLFWAFLLVHPIVMLLAFLYQFFMCLEKQGSSPLCILVDLYWICLPLLLPVAIPIKILMKSFSLPALLKTGLAICLTILIGFLIFGYSMIFLAGFVYVYLSFLQG